MAGIQRSNTDEAAVVQLARAGGSAGIRCVLPARVVGPQRRDHARRDRNGLLELDGPPAANVTAVKVGAYLAELKTRVALLGFCPIRRKNFGELEIGRSFVRIRSQWWIVLSAAETKEKRADERPVNKLLTPIIDRYIAEHRPILARSTGGPMALWLSANDGAPITPKELTRVIRKTTRSTVGVAVSPHLFRTSAASSAAVHRGDNPHLASAVLHHTDPDFTTEHYNRASSLSATESFRQMIRRYEKSSFGRIQELRKGN